MMSDGPFYRTRNVEDGWRGHGSLAYQEGEAGKLSSKDRIGTIGRSVAGAAPPAEEGRP